MDPRKRECACLGCNTWTDNTHRRRVEEQYNQQEDDQEQEEAQDVPLEPAPDDVAQGLERRAEPRERRGWPTVTQQNLQRDYLTNQSRLSVAGMLADCNATKL